MPNGISNSFDFRARLHSIMRIKKQCIFFEKKEMSYWIKNRMESDGRKKGKYQKQKKGLNRVPLW